MSRRWLVVEHDAVLARCWTEKGARRFVAGLEAWRANCNKAQRDRTAPGAVLPSPFPRGVNDVQIMEAR